MYKLISSPVQVDFWNMGLKAEKWHTEQCSESHPELQEAPFPNLEAEKYP